LISKNWNKNYIKKKHTPQKIVEKRCKAQRRRDRNGTVAKRRYSE